MMPVFVSDELCGPLDSAPDPIVLVDAEGRIAFTNARAEAVFGYDRAELTGQPIEVLIPEWDRVGHWIRTGTDGSGSHEYPAVHPGVEDFTPSGRRKDGTEFPIRIDGWTADRVVLVIVTGASTPADGTEFPLTNAAPVRELFPRAKEGRAVQAEPHQLHQDWLILWELMTVYPITRTADGRVQLYHGPFRPVTVRTETGRSAARFQALFEATTAGMVELSPDGTFLSANGAFCRMVGYTLAELTELTAGDVLFPEDRPRVLAQLSEVAAGRVPGYEVDRRYRRKDGSALWARVSVRARDGIGQTSGASAVVIDLSDRKHLEDRLQRAQNAEAVVLRASGLAHDFKNLMTVINGCEELLRDELPPAGPLRELVLEMTTACRRAAELAAQLLALGRATPTEPRVFDLNEVVARSVRSLHRLLGPNVALVTDLGADPSAVKADPAQMEQVILNLATNARDAMPQGGVLTIETRAVRVRPGDRGAAPDLPPGEYVQLVVSDTGAGMTNEVKARAFEPFFTTKDVGKGTGLGLAAVHGAIAPYGGRVDVYSELGVGSSFEILLPAVTARPLPATGRIQLAPRAPGTVLLVEPESAARKLARLALGAHGYEVLEATCAADALQMARDHTGPIELLLTNAGERDLVRVLQVRHPNIKVLHLGGSAGDAAVQPGTDEPAPDVRKSFTPLSLAHKVRSVLDGTI